MNKLTRETRDMRWEKIKDYNEYSVSDTGYVRNDKRNKVKTFTLNGMGYRRVQLYNNGKPQHIFLHKLVYETFMGEIPTDKVVTHRDKNKLNNRLDNLKLIPKNQNFKTTNKYRRYTEDTKKQVWEDISNNIPLEKLKDKYGISLTYLYKIKNEKLWKV